MVSVILIEPAHPGNIGAIARIMKNFGSNSLILVRPKCDHTNQEARNRAKHAQDVLVNASVVEEIPPMHTIIATTSQTGTDYNIPRSPLTPRQCAEITSSSDNIGIVFGREGEGMHSDEIKKCDYVVTIPASLEYGTLNLSHSVAILLYEFFIQSDKDNLASHIVHAQEEDKSQIMKLLEEVLLKQSYSTEEKRETQRIVWKRMIGKSFLTKREAFALMGFLKKLL